MDQTAKTTSRQAMDLSRAKPSISKLATEMAVSSGTKKSVRPELKTQRPSLVAPKKAQPRTTFIDGTSSGSAREVINSATSDAPRTKATKNPTESFDTPKTVQKKPARSIYALASKESEDIEVIDEETLLAEMEGRENEAIKTSVSKVVEEPTRSIYALAPRTTSLGRKTVRRVSNSEPEKTDEAEAKPKKRAGLFSAFRNKSVRYIPPEEDASSEVEELSSDELLQKIDQGTQPEVEKEITNTVVEETKTPVKEEDTELLGYVSSARDLINASAKNLRETEVERAQESQNTSSDEDVLMKAFEEESEKTPQEMPSVESSKVTVPLVRETVHPTMVRPDKAVNTVTAAERKLQIAKAQALKQRAASQVNDARKVINQARKTPIQATPVVKTSLRLKPVSPRDVRVVEKKNDIARIIQKEQRTEDDQSKVPRLQATTRRRVRPVRNIDIMQPTQKRPRRAKVPIEVQVVPQPQNTPKSTMPIKHTKGPVTIAISVPGEQDKIHNVATNSPKIVQNPENYDVPVVKRAVPPSVEKFMIDQPDPSNIKVNHTRETLASKTVDDMEFGIIEDYYSGSETDTIAANRMIKLSKNPDDPVQMMSNLMGNPEQKRFPLGAKSPFLKTVNVEKRPLSEPMEHPFVSEPVVEKPKLETKPVEKKPFNARDYFLKPEDQKPAPTAKNADTKDKHKADKKSKKVEKDTKESRKATKKAEKPVKKSRRERRQEKAMMAPTVIVPSHNHSSAPLVLLAVVTIILGAAVGAAVYMCLVLET